MADKYKKMKRQVSTDNGVTWNDVIPYEYIAGDLIEASSPDCSSVEWRVASGYICESTEEAVETRWIVVAGEYECVGYDKYNREKEQISVDGGEHWTDTGNTRAGSILIESDSTDCGYVPPTPTDYSTRYLTIVSETDNNRVYFMCDSSSVRKTISYSLDDGTTWSTKAADVQSGTYFATLNTGDKMLLKGTNSTYGNSSFESNQLDCGNRFKLEGNVMSLIYGDNFIGQTTLTGTYAFSGLFVSEQLDNIDNLVMPATTLTEGCYRHMFYRCIFTSVPSNLLPATTLQSGCYEGMFTYCVNLTAAPELPATTLADNCYNDMFYNCTGLTSAPSVLPATTLAEFCYDRMFDGCTSLTSVPVLSATTMARGCCSSMFEDCTSLTTVPDLPATTLASSCYAGMFSGCTSLTIVPSNLLPATTLTYDCYRGMFGGCTSLTTAPDLPATTLVYGCYAGMFYNCSSLNYIKCLATNKSATDCTTDWLYSVASTGTFVKASSATWSTGTSGIPSGWTVQNA